MWIWMLPALALSLGWAVALLRRRATTSAALAVLFVTGGVAALWLTDPLWFPAMELRPRGPADLVALAVIAIQGAVALAVLMRLGGGASGMMAAIGRLGWLRVATLCALILVLSAPLQGYWGWFASYALHLVAEGAVAGIALLTLVALVLSAPVGMSLPRPAPWMLALVVFAASLAMGHWAFEGLPHVEDELAYLLQARGFAQGAASFPAPAEAILPALDFYLFDVAEGRWLATTPPGWPLVLAVGEALGLPGLVNPFLAALSVLLLHAVLTRLADRDTADIGTLLMATSPWIIAMAASLMTHTLTLFLLLLSWWLLTLPARTGRAGAALALAAGLAMGWLFATRQLDGVILGTLTGLWLLRRGVLAGLGRAAAYGLGCIATGSIYLLHNAATTGSALVSPLARYIERLWGPGKNTFGFGADAGPPVGTWGKLDLFPGHSPLEAAVILANNLASVEFEAFGWPTGSLFLVLVFILWGRWRGVERMLAGLAVVFLAVMLFYWFAGAFYIGPRYWFVLVPVLLVLSAGGLRTVEARLGTNRAGTARLGLWVLCLHALVVFTPWIGWARYHEARNVNDDLHAALDPAAIGNALVFVTSGSNMGSAFMLNDMALPDDRPIFLRDMGPEANDRIRAAYPDRPALFVATR